MYIINFYVIMRAVDKQHAAKLICRKHIEVKVKKNNKCFIAVEQGYAYCNKL